MDNNEWLLQYDNIEYGIFAVQFQSTNQQVTAINVKANDFVEYDPYTFTRQP
jgi:hypothetical protein